MSIYSTDFCQGGIIPVFGNQSIGRIVGAGGEMQRGGLVLKAYRLNSRLESNKEEEDAGDSVREGGRSPPRPHQPSSSLLYYSQAYN